MEVNLHWHYRQNHVFHIQGTGTAYIHVTLDVALSLRFYMNQDHLQVESIPATVNIEGLDIHVDGKGA